MVISLSFYCDSGYMDSQQPMVFNGGNFAANFYPSNEWVSMDVDIVTTSPPFLGILHLLSAF